MSGRAAAPGLDAAVKMAASYGPALTSATNCFFASSSSTLWNAQQEHWRSHGVDSATSRLPDANLGICKPRKSTEPGAAHRASRLHVGHEQAPFQNALCGRLQLRDEQLLLGELVYYLPHRLATAHVMVSQSDQAANRCLLPSGSRLILSALSPSLQLAKHLERLHCIGIATAMYYSSDSHLPVPNK